MLSDEEIVKRKKIVLLGLLALLLVVALGAVPLMLNEDQPSGVALRGTETVSPPTQPATLAATTIADISTPTETATPTTALTQPGEDIPLTDEAAPDEFVVSSPDSPTTIPGGDSDQITPETPPLSGTDETKPTQTKTPPPGLEGDAPGSNGNQTAAEATSEPGAAEATVDKTETPTLAAETSGSDGGKGETTGEPPSITPTDGDTSQITPSSEEQSQATPESTPVEPTSESPDSPAEQPGNREQQPDATPEAGADSKTATPTIASAIAEHMRGEATGVAQTDPDSLPVQEETPSAGSETTGETQGTEGESQTSTGSSSNTPESSPPDRLPITGASETRTGEGLIWIAFSLISLLLLYGAVATYKVDP
jgi:hypothetical protein